MLVRAWQTGQAIYNLVSLEAGPQSLPASTRFLWAALLLYGLSEFGLASLRQGMGASLLAGLIAVLLLALLTAVSLSFIGYPSRIVQTLSALASAGVVVNCSRIVLLLMLQATEPVANLGPFLLFPLLIWHFLICVRVYRAAFTQGYIHSLSLAFAYILGLGLLRMSLKVWA